MVKSYYEIVVLKKVDKNFFSKRRDIDTAGVRALNGSK